MTFSRTNHANHALRYCIFFCNITLRFSGIRSGFYVCYLFVSEFAARLVVVSPFAKHVFNVVTIGAQKQVGWIDTFRVVAKVANTHLWWNWPVYKFPRYAVSEIRFPSIFKLSVCSPRLAGVFNTAVVALSASLFKSSLHGNFPWWNSALAFCGAQPRTQALPSYICRGRMKRKLLPAYFTNFSCCSHA